MLTGERSVTWADRTTVRYSMDELLKLEQRILAELNASAGRPKQSIGIGNKGLY